MGNNNSKLKLEDTTEIRRIKQACKAPRRQNARTRRLHALGFDNSAATQMRDEMERQYKVYNPYNDERTIMFLSAVQLMFEEEIDNLINNLMRELMIDYDTNDQ